jgi:hypothetical protein
MIAITHPIKQMINSQYGFLSSMLDRFPSLLDEWIEKQKEEVEQLAKEYAERDYEVYRDTYNSEISRIDPCYGEESLFNQAMLIMVYSYYESMLRRLAKESGIKENWPSAVAAKYDVMIDGEYLKIATFLHNTMLPLRNQLCHNNNGTLYARSKDSEIENINKLIQNKYISEDDGRIYITNRNFVKQVLDGEHKLLLKLAEICGFKTRWYAYKDGKKIVYDNYDQIEE